jgi:hypothetical protein
MGSLQEVIIPKPLQAEPFSIPSFTPQLKAHLVAFLLWLIMVAFSAPNFLLLLK